MPLMTEFVKILPAPKPISRLPISKPKLNIDWAELAARMILYPVRVLVSS